MLGFRRNQNRKNTAITAKTARTISMMIGKFNFFDLTGVGVGSGASVTYIGDFSISGLGGSSDNRGGTVNGGLAGSIDSGFMLMMSW